MYPERRAALTNDARIPLSIYMSDCLLATWFRVREMANEFPHADFTSVDIVPHVPHVPRPNILGYEVYDVYNGIAEADESFDLVHMRHVTSKVGLIAQTLKHILTSSSLG